MFEEHNPIYRFIFRHGRGWTGKLSGCTIIGGLTMGLASLGAHEPSVKAEWTSWAMAGGAMGFFAALILIARDLRNGVDIDDERRARVRVPSAWASVLFVAAMLGTFVTLVVGCLWFMDQTQHHR
jgi:hypothetical protein